VTDPASGECVLDIAAPLSLLPASELVTEAREQTS
jgi:hypothetical protein